MKEFIRKDIATVGKGVRSAQRYDKLRPDLPSSAEKWWNPEAVEGAEPLQTVGVEIHILMFSVLKCLQVIISTSGSKAEAQPLHATLFYHLQRIKIKDLWQMGSLLPSEVVRSILSHSTHSAFPHLTATAFCCMPQSGLMPSLILAPSSQLLSVLAVSSCSIVSGKIFSTVLIGTL